jgi:hypothetical protein
MVDRRAGFDMAPDDNVDECALKRFGLSADPRAREHARNVGSVSHCPSGYRNG